MYNFHNSPDHDRPGNKQYLVFAESDNYQMEGETHGKLSHAIKHYEEFDKVGMDNLLNSAMDYIKTVEVLFLKNLKGEIIAQGTAAIEKLTLKSLHNTFDFINDKIMKGIVLSEEEAQIKTQFLKPLEEKYDSLINDYLSNHIEDSYVDGNDFHNFYKRGKRLKFQGIFDNKLYYYILDFSNSGILVLDENQIICTLFRIDKQGNCLEEIKSYFSRNIEIVSSLGRDDLRKFLYT